MPGARPGPPCVQALEGERSWPPEAAGTTGACDCGSIQTGALLPGEPRSQGVKGPVTRGLCVALPTASTWGKRKAPAAQTQLGTEH